VCIGCVASSGFDRPAGAAPGEPADVSRPGPPELREWSAGDAAQAAVVYRQLPRWSKRLFDLLSSAPGQRFPLSETRARVFAADDPRSAWTTSAAGRMHSARRPADRFPCTRSHWPAAKPGTGWTSRPRRCSRAWRRVLDHKWRPRATLRPMSSWSVQGSPG
jgi:hypothetical protein